MICNEMQRWKKCFNNLHILSQCIMIHTEMRITIQRGSFFLYCDAPACMILWSCGMFSEMGIETMLSKTNAIWGPPQKLHGAAVGAHLWGVIGSHWETLSGLHAIIIIKSLITGWNISKRPLIISWILYFRRDYVRRNPGTVGAMETASSCVMS